MSHGAYLAATFIAGRTEEEAEPSAWDSDGQISLSNRNLFRIKIAVRAFGILRFALMSLVVNAHRQIREVHVVAGRLWSRRSTFNKSSKETHVGTKFWSREVLGNLQKAIFSMIAATFFFESLAGAQTASEVEKPDLAERKFEFEQKLETQKLKLEQDKLNQERRQKWVTTFSVLATSGSVIVALILGVVTILGQFRLKRRDFEMKAAEIIMGGDNPWATIGKAEALTNPVHAEPKQTRPDDLDSCASRHTPGKASLTDFRALKAKRPAFAGR
jgi:hypothetical protein